MRLQTLSGMHNYPVIITIDRFIAHYLFTLKYFSIIIIIILNHKYITFTHQNLAFPIYFNKARFIVVVLNKKSQIKLLFTKITYIFGFIMSRAFVSSPNAPMI